MLLLTRACLSLRAQSEQGGEACVRFLDLRVHQDKQGKAQQISAETAQGHKRRQSRALKGRPHPGMNGTLCQKTEKRGTA